MHEGCLIRNSTRYKITRGPNYFEEVEFRIILWHFLKSRKVLAFQFRSGLSRDSRSQRTRTSGAGYGCRPVRALQTKPTSPQKGSLCWARLSSQTPMQIRTQPMPWRPLAAQLQAGDSTGTQQPGITYGLALHWKK